MNKTILMGNITRDPEMKSLPSGMKVTNFSIATNRVWYDNDKQKPKQVEYHNVVAFGKQAENIARYFKKGSKILIEGRLQTQSWDDKDTGKKMYRTEVVVDKFHFTGSAKESNNGGGGYTGPNKYITKQVETLDTIEYPEEYINPEDIPF